MPSVLRHPDRPPVHDIDPSLVNGINFGFAESDKEGGDYVLDNEQDGSYGLLSPHNQTETTDRETIDRVATVIENELDNSKFALDDPEKSMRNIFDLAQKEISEFMASQEESYATKFDMTLVKTFIDPDDGELKVVYGHTGRHWIALQKPAQSLQSLSKEYDDSLLEQGIGIPPIEDGAAEFGVISFAEAEQLLILSRNAAGYEKRESYTEKEIKEALRTPDHNDAADLLIQRNKHYENRTALVIRAPYGDRDDAVSGEDDASYEDDMPNGRLSWMTRMTNRGRLRDMNVNEEASPRRTNRERRSLGSLAMLGAGGAAALAKFRIRRRDRDQESDSDSRWPFWLNQNSEQDDVILNEDDTRTVAGDHEYVEARRGGAKRTLLLGALAVGSVLALRHGFDLGDEIANWLGDKPDSGIDFWAFGDGDKDQGDNSGLDFNPSNENLWRNDDPVNVDFKDTKGFDLAPPFIDGDWFSLTGGDVTVDDIDLTPPDVDIDPPEIDVPPIEVDPPVVTPPPPVWQPEMFTVEPGSSLSREIHDLGHQMVGNANFTGADTSEVLQATLDRFGPDIISLSDNAGPSTYQYNGETRISAPGQAQWASQEIENFVYDKIQELGN